MKPFAWALITGIRAPRNLVVPIVGVIILLTSSRLVQAQIKLAVFDAEEETKSKIKGVAFEDAKKADDFKHGNLLQLTLKDNSRVVGTLVWADKKNKRLYLRRGTGMPPQPFDEKQITKVQKGVKEAKGKKQKGKNEIIPAALAPAPAVVNQPEILRITEINGNLTTVRYYAPELSPGEKMQLHDMEAAENQAARTQYLMSQILDSVGNQAQMLRYQQLLAAKQAEIMTIYATEQSWLSSYSPYYATDFFGGAQPGTMYSQSYAGTGGILGGNSSAGATVSSMDSLIAKSLALEATLEKANRALTTARSHGLYDGGELIAVQTPAEPAVMPAADKGQ